MCVASVAHTFLFSEGIMKKEMSAEEFFAQNGYYKYQKDFVMKCCENCGHISDDKICPKCSTSKEYTLTQFYKFSKKAESSE